LEHDPHIILQPDCHTFSLSLEDRLKQDVDSLDCFLHSFQIALEAQRLHRQVLTKRARLFS